MNKEKQEEQDRIKREAASAGASPVRDLREGLTRAGEFWNHKLDAEHAEQEEEDQHQQELQADNKKLFKTMDRVSSVGKTVSSGVTAIVSSPKKAITTTAVVGERVGRKSAAIIGGALTAAAEVVRSPSGRRAGGGQRGDSVEQRGGRVAFGNVEIRDEQQSRWDEERGQTVGGTRTLLDEGASPVGSSRSYVPRAELWRSWSGVFHDKLTRRVS